MTLKIIEKAKLTFKKQASIRLDKYDIGKKPIPYCFLFNDILLHCDQVTSKGQQVDRPFVFNHCLCLVEVKSINTQSTKPRVIKITLLDGRIWKLKAKTPEIRAEWEETLRTVLSTIISS